VVRALLIQEPVCYCKYHTQKHKNIYNKKKGRGRTHLNLGLPTPLARAFSSKAGPFFAMYKTILSITAFTSAGGAGGGGPVGEQV
jgi:hypothetical protein